MKKILLAVTAALAITGCSQNEEFEKIGQNSEINFGTIVGNSTRADIVTQDNFESFTVNGFRTTGAMSTNPQLAAGFMDNVLVTKEAGSDNWGMEKTYYWPTTGYVQFFATSPARTLVLTSAGYPTFEYTVGAIDTQSDLLVANQIDKEKSSIDANGVILPFKHALTQVNFSVKGDTKDITYKISELSIAGVKDKGVFAFDGTDGAGSWTSTSSSTPAINYTYKPATPVEFTVTNPSTDTATQLDEANKSLFMLLPQTVTADMILSVTYIAIPKDKTEEIDQTFKGTKTVALTGTWEMGKKIRYTLTLTSDAKAVTLGTPTVGPWEGDTNTPLTPETPKN